MTYDEDEDARFGMVLDAEYTGKLIEICNYMDKTPYDVLVDAIDTMHVWYITKQEKTKNGR